MRLGERLRCAQRPDWTDALFVVLAVGCVLVPCVFTTRLHAVFALPKLTVLWVLLALDLGIVVIGMLRSNTIPSTARPLRRVDAAVLVFLGISLLAYAHSTDREQSLYGEQLQYQGLLTLLLYIGFFFVARLAASKRWTLRGLLWAITIGASLVSGYALVQKAGLDPIWHGYLPGGHVFSSIGQANALAAYLVMTVPLSAALVFGSNGALRTFLLLATAAMIASFVLAQSRGGYLGLGTALIVLAVGWRREIRLGTRGLAAVAALAGAGVVFIALTHASSTLETFRHFTPRTDASVRFHLDAWRVATEIAKDHPFLGTGPDTFPEVFPRYSHQVLPRRRAVALDAFRVESPHNVYLSVAAGSGIPALVAYLAIVVGLFTTIVGALRNATGRMRIALVAVLAALTGHLMTDAFMTAEITSSWLFWLVGGATLGWSAAATGGTLTS